MTPVLIPCSRSRGGMAPVELLCSRKRSQTPLVGRAQREINQPPEEGNKQARKDHW